MKNIYFKGYYVFKNLGDDIFAVTADWICNNLWTGYNQVFLGNELPILSKKSKRFNTKNTFLRRIYEVIICFKVDYIIYYGGSLFSGGISGFTDIKYYLNKFKIFHSKLGTVGTSIGPFKNAADFNSIKELLEKFKFIAVRDYSSHSILKNMDLEDKSLFCFDNAILIRDVYPELSVDVNRKIKIGISLCHYERYNGGNLSSEKEREESVLRLLENIIENDNEIDELVFIVFNGSENVGDLEITKQFNEILKDKIKTRIVKYSSDTEKLVKEINDCKFIIGTRLHSGILAYALDIPFILVEYHEKCTDFLDTINHNYRFKVNDSDNNLFIFNKLWKENKIPDIIPPNYFRNIMINSLKSIQEKLDQ